jgi:hypothetical protein
MGGLKGNQPAPLHQLLDAVLAERTIRSPMHPENVKILLQPEHCN